MATPYNHKAIEQKWRKHWQEHPVNVNDGKKPKYYCLDMFPYPSGVPFPLYETALYEILLPEYVVPSSSYLHS